MLGEHGLLRPLTKRVIARALAAALTEHVGDAPHVRQEREGNHGRHGTGKNTVQTETAPCDIAVPRARDGRCEPPLVKKRQRRLEGCDETGVAWYARGLATREMQAHLEAL